jgi:hypothetical protein
VSIEFVCLLRNRRELPMPTQSFFAMHAAMPASIGNAG